jgi:hypothetical protein
MQAYRPALQLAAGYSVGRALRRWLCMVLRGHPERPAKSQSTESECGPCPCRRTRRCLSASPGRATDKSGPPLHQRVDELRPGLQRGRCVDRMASLPRCISRDLPIRMRSNRPPEPCAQNRILPGASRMCTRGAWQPVCGHCSGRGHGFGRGCVGQVRWCSMRHRWDWSGGHSPSASPARRRVRSSGGPPAPYERGASCPAPAISSPAGALVLGLATVRRQGTAIVRRSALVVPFPTGPLGQRSAGDTERGAAGAATTGGLRHGAGMR